jgi:hypothetical protein
MGTNRTIDPAEGPVKNRTLLWAVTTGLMGLGAGLLIGLSFAPGAHPAGATGSVHSAPRAASTSQAQVAPAGYPLVISAAGAHSHQQTEVPAGAAAPALRLEVLPDPMKEGNFSLHLITENFRFAPESVSRSAVFGEGHAHVYVDDYLLFRSYGPWVHIPRLTPGRHLIYVTLNGNNHDEYAVAGRTVCARATLEVK